MENQDHQHSLDVVSSNNFEAIWLEIFWEKKTQQEGNKYNPLVERIKNLKSSFHTLSVENLILLFLPFPPHQKKKSTCLILSHIYLASEPCFLTIHFPSDMVTDAVLLPLYIKLQYTFLLGLSVAMPAALLHPNFISMRESDNDNCFIPVKM